MHTCSRAFLRAKWHASTFGIAGAARHARRTSDIREPECVNLRSWARALRDVRGLAASADYSAIVTLIEDYLCSVPGTPVVERWLGEVAMQEAKSRARKLTPLHFADAVRLVRQDDRGRCPGAAGAAKARQMLVKAAPHATRAGGRVVWPATDFGMRAQRVYAKTLWG